MRQVVDTVNRTHHKKSISKLNYYAACPGFESKPWEENEAATEGTMLHSYMELAIEWALSNKSSVAEGVLHAITNLPIQQRLVPWKEEHKELLDFCAVYADKYLSKPEFAGLKQELKVDLKPHADTAGHFDVIIFFGEAVGLLLDWKFGRIPVPASSENYQGMGYAAGCFLKWKNLKKLGVVFIQPRLFTASEALFNRATDMQKILTEINGILVATEARDKVLRPNPYCSYCAYQTDCPAVLGHFGKAVSSYHNLPVPASFDGNALTAPADIALLRYWVDLLEPIAESIKAKSLQAAVENGGSIEAKIGDTVVKYEVRERASARVLGPPNLIAEALKGHLIPEQVLGAAKLSLGKLEAIWADEMVANKQAASKKEAVAGLESILSEDNLISRSDYKIQFLQQSRKKVVKSLPKA